jgi:hypothetical protein
MLRTGSDGKNRIMEEEVESDPQPLTTSAPMSGFEEFEWGREACSVDTLNWALVNVLFSGPSQLRLRTLVLASHWKFQSQDSGEGLSFGKLPRCF